MAAARADDGGDGTRDPSGDEEKKDDDIVVDRRSGGAEEGAGGPGGSAGGLREQRAARLRGRRALSRHWRRRRGDGDGEGDGDDEEEGRSGDRRESIGEAEPDEATVATKARKRAKEEGEADDGGGGGGSDDESDRRTSAGYATAHAFLRAKYPHHFPSDERGGGDGIAPALVSEDRRPASPKRARLSSIVFFHFFARLVPRKRTKRRNLRRRERDARRALGARLIRRRWERRARRSDAAVESPHAPGRASGVEPAVVRRGNVAGDYSSSRRYASVAFLDYRTVVAIDSKGNADVVGVPRLVDPAFEDDDGGGRDAGGGPARCAPSDAGGLLAAMPLLRSRRPMPPGCRPAIYARRGGEAFAVGLPSGRVRLFSSERGEPSRTASTTNDATAADPGDRRAAWRCLPSTAAATGPRRRYSRQDASPLASMLRGDASFLRGFRENFFGERMGWDDDDGDDAGFYGRGDRRPNAPRSSSRWAFREGGSGSLVGAFVDEDGDCFSLRTFDERVNGGRATGSDAVLDVNAKATRVYVDASPLPDGRRSAKEEDATSVCFAGEFGLATAHASSSGGGGGDVVLKWWDRRALRAAPVGIATPSFPRDDVAGVSSEWDRPAGRLGLDRTSDARGGGTTGLRPRSTPPRATLVGSDDAGDDRIAMSLVDGGREDVLIFDATRRRVVRRERVHCGKYPDPVQSCFSRCLDFAACPAKEAGDGDESDPPECVSIFDLSRRAPGRDVDADARGGMRHLLGRKRRRSPSSADARLPEGEGGGVVGRFSPVFRDACGIKSSLTCMALDEDGGSIAFGTGDCDVYILRGR